MRNYLVFGGVDSRDYGIYISGNHTFNSPQREYENISVPGRDGDLLGTSTRLANIELTYPAFFYKPDLLAAFRSKLLSMVGYADLEDTYNPDEFRKAVYKGGLEAEMMANLSGGSFDLVFECKPQRYLKDGQILSPVSSGMVINNPTDFRSQPLIRTVGSGTLVIGSQTITVASNSYSYINIDCEMMDCYSGANNCNSLVSFSGNDFPVLEPGPNNVTITGLTSMMIKTNTWRV